jgi:predicted DNA-binding protein (MmcQ/YjbR family)
MRQTRPAGRSSVRIAMTPDAIFSRATFGAFVLALPAATLVRQWRDDSVAKVGRKIFCLLDKDDGEIWLKVSDLGFAMMTELPGVRPAPYFARAGWVAIAPISPSAETRSGPISWTRIG